ncbi:MAG: cyclic nucleotide-binding domain-containing protein [Deltaproteobacteria bacterium]|nr:cyclic nucleotide-binding domain-containing protein [Deltaproteobacteria bacterium]
MIESKYLKDTVQNIQQLFTIPALKNFETKNLGKMLNLSKIRKYEDGEQIIKEGDRDPWLYFLLSGEVRVTKEGEDIITLNKVGDIFGEMRLLDSLSRSASVVAVGTTTCLAVNIEAPDRVPSEDENTNFLILLYRVLAEYVSIRLRLSNEELVKTKKQLKALMEKE